MRESYDGIGWSDLDWDDPHDDVIRFVRLFPPHFSDWRIQEKYTRGERNQWRKPNRDLTPEDVRRHLLRAGNFWIATRSREAAEEPVTAYVILDFDAKGGTSPETALRRLRDVAAYIGDDVPPLVATTPGGGYHAIWFLERVTPLSSLVKLRAPQTSGPLPDIVRAAIGVVGPSRCEIFPGRGQVVRLPFGAGQDLLDLDTGELIDDLPAILRVAEHHYSTAPRLSVDRIRQVQPRRQSRGQVRAAPESMGEPDDSAQGSERINSETLAKAVDWYENGLREKGTRNAATFAVALAMVHEPDALLAGGFDPERPPEDQLFEWLAAKHNGQSADYPGQLSDPEQFWRDECARVIESARRGSLSADLLARLTDQEWDFVFAVGDRHARTKADRYNLEVVVASVLRKAKSSVLYRDFKPDSDGTYHAEIMNEWWMQIRGCTHLAGFTRFRNRLIAIGVLERGQTGSRKTGRGTMYRKLPLQFGGPQPDLPSSPAHLPEVARLLGEDLPYLEYCFLVEKRYPGRELGRRYGSRPARRVRTLTQQARERLTSGVGDPFSP